ncbi:cell wall hydrolase [Stakelama pacifica]|nr:cell wall hydrolase [Stakelama pacifica]
MFRRPMPGLVPALILLAMFVAAAVSAMMVMRGMDSRDVAVSDQVVASADRPTGAIAPENTVATDPAELAPLTAETAVARNAEIPVQPGALRTARAFNMGRAGNLDFARALDCLTAAIYYEAAGEPISGQRGVAQVVLNRVRHPAYPNTVCGVVFQGAERRTGCQFSFACDGSLAHPPMAGGWRLAQGLAAAALQGRVEPDVGLATHYHADYVLPLWSPHLVKLAVLGHHIFLRWPGSWGQPGAFGRGYHGGEPAIDWRNGFGGAPIGTGMDAPADGQAPVQAPDSVMPARRPLLPMNDSQSLRSAADGPAASYVAPEERRVIFSAPSSAPGGGGSGAAKTSPAAPSSDQ